MQVVGAHILKEFSKKYPPARRPLARWLKLTEDAKWKKPQDVRAMFKNVSFVGETAIFDIGGNKYRLLSRIHYDRELVVIYEFLDHEDYDKEKIK